MSDKPTQMEILFQIAQTLSAVQSGDPDRARLLFEYWKLYDAVTKSPSQYISTIPIDVDSIRSCA